MSVKVGRNDIPLLVIGVGGTGRDIASAIKRKFSMRFNDLDPITLLPKKTSFLVLDTDIAYVSHDPHSITVNEICNIGYPNLAEVLSRGAFYPEERKWFNPKLSQTPLTFMGGTGCIRQIGRLHLFRAMPKVLQEVTNALNQILSLSPSSCHPRAINILICGSLCGGTGSGIALDMAYIIQQLFRERFPSDLVTPTIFGMFLMPECIIQKTGRSLLLPQLLRANAFAAMKEIDYWMRQNDHGDTLTVTYPGITSNWINRPFNYLGYLGHTWEKGNQISNAYEVATEKIAELFLLLSTEAPQEQEDEETQFNIYSMLSNAPVLMHIHQDNAPYPVSSFAMSLGLSVFSSSDSKIQAFLVQKALNQVLQIQLGNSEGQKEVSEQKARAKSIPNGMDALGLRERKDLFFQNPSLNIYPEDYFIETTAYPTIVGMITKEAIRQANSSYVDSINNYHAKQQKQITVYYNEYFEQIWDNFKEEAKNAIKALYWGPVAFLKFLDEEYIPYIAQALESTKDMGCHNQEDELSFLVEQDFINLKKLLSPGLDIQLLIANTRWNDYARLYEEHARNYSSAICHRMCMVGKAIALTEYLDKLSNYRDNLYSIIEAVRKEEEELEADAAQEGVSCSLLSSELLDQYNNCIYLPDSSISKARDQILCQIADFSFELSSVPIPGSFEERTQLLHQFTKRVLHLAQACFLDENLISMDQVLDAAVQGTKATAQNYMATFVAPKLKDAAEPMLQLKTAFRTAPEGYFEYHHIEVPSNAPNAISGLSQYLSNHGYRQFDCSKSSIVDRILFLNLKAGIPMYMMADTYSMMSDYEKLLTLQTNLVSQGLHLVETNLVNSLSDTSASIDTNWYRLPCPIPPVEMNEYTSPTQIANQEYLQKLFHEAVLKGIITFAGGGEASAYIPGDPNGYYEQDVFEIHELIIDNKEQANLIDSLSIEEIKKRIIEINNMQLEPSSRLAELKELLQSKTVYSINFGKYMFNYAYALNALPIKPDSGDDKATCSLCASHYIETRDKLCSYMLSCYPRHLDAIEKALAVIKMLDDANLI